MKEKAFYSLEKLFEKKPVDIVIRLSKVNSETLRHQRQDYFKAFIKPFEAPQRSVKIKI